MQLRYDNALCAVDNEGASLRHIRDGSEIDILHDGLKILVLDICAFELQLCLQRHTLSQTTLQTLLNGVTRRVDIVIEKFEFEIVSCVSDWEVLAENTVETLVLAVLCCCIHLEEIPERFELYLQQIRIRHSVADCGETNSFFLCCSGHVEIHLFLL